MFPCYKPDCTFACYNELRMKKHKQNLHNLFEEEPQTPTDNGADDLYNYSKANSSLGTLLMNIDDAIQEGVGKRLQKVLSVIT